MKVVKKIFSSKSIVTLAWIIGIMLIWEIAALYIEQIKRTPENVLPHISQIIESIFSDKMVSNNQTALQIVLVNAKDTLLRAGTGFIIGMACGFILALIMELSGIVEKMIFPYLMALQMIPIV